jgi:hypothetical protein
MCVIVIAASKLKVKDVTGYNPLSSDGQDICGEEMKMLEEDIHTMKNEHSNDADRMSPLGPTCTHICDVQQKPHHHQSSTYQYAVQDERLHKYQTSHFFHPERIDDLRYDSQCRWATLATFYLYEAKNRLPSAP